MEGHTFISWNIPNTITVILMGVLGIVVLKIFGKFWQNRNGASA